MAKVLYAWELGGDLGHLGCVLPIATRLQSRGIEVEFVIRDISKAELLLGRNNFDFLPAPTFHNKNVSPAVPPINYSDILLRYGYHETDCLTGLIKAWLRLYAYSKPDLILADHSPTALLAAHIAGLPAADFGYGFTMPPLESPFPNMRPWLHLSQAALKQPERAVLTAINGAMDKLGKKRLSAVQEIFSGLRERFLCTFAELDHYPDRKQGRYWGSIFTYEEGIELDWPAEGKYRILAYLKANYSAYKDILSALAKLGHSTIVCSPDISPDVLDSFKYKNIRISAKPLRLSKIAPQCDLAISHSGHGTVASMLLHGVPLLLLPTHLEQFLLASRAEALGAALIATPDAKRMNYFSMLEQLLTVPSFRQAAAKFRYCYCHNSVGQLQDELQNHIADEISSIAGLS